MTGWRAAAAAACTLAMLGGCASFPKGGEANAPDAPATPARAAYRLQVDAPEPLRKLLSEYLDLARFQSAPEADSIEGAELERLMRATPAQARELLETEGYFNAKVTVPAATGGDDGLPLVRVIVEPGPRPTVSAVTPDGVG